MILSTWKYEAVRGIIIVADALTEHIPKEVKKIIEAGGGIVMPKELEVERK